MADIFVTFKGDLPLSQGAIDDFLHLLNVHNLQELQAATPTYVSYCFS